MTAEGTSTGSGVERALAAELVREVRRDVGLTTRIGLAHGKMTSRIVTQYLVQRDVMVLPPGKEVVFLGGLATRYLPMSLDNHRRLTQLGLTKIHQYAGLPSRGVLPRFGYDGLRAYELAHGSDDAHVRPWEEEPLLASEHVFLDPIVDLQVLHHHIEQLVGRVAKPLAAQFQMAGALNLTIAFEDGSVSSRQRTLAEPVNTPTSLLTHVDALLAQFTWSAPVERVTVGARGLCPTRGRQLELFRSEHEQRSGALSTLRRIQAKFGAEVVQQGHHLEPDSPLHERRAYLTAWEA